MTGLRIEGADVRADLDVEQPADTLLPEGDEPFTRPPGIATAGDGSNANIAHDAPAAEVLPEGTAGFTRPPGIATAGDGSNANIAHDAPAADILPEGTAAFTRPPGIATAGDDVSANIRFSRRNAGEFAVNAAVLSFVPGSDGSAYPAPVDSWFHGAGVDELDESLTKALNDERNLAEYDEPVPRFSLDNSISIEYASSDGETLDFARVSQDPFDLGPVTLVGGSVLRNRLRSFFENSPTISDPWDSQKPVPFGPFVTHEEVTIDGIEGIRASVILGGTNPYLDVLGGLMREYSPAAFFSELDLETNAALAEYVRSNPLLYSFLEVVLLADGSQVVKLWDASPFPRHAVYLHGSKLGHTEFERGTDWEPNERVNEQFLTWLDGADSPLRTPGAPGIYLGYESLFTGDATVDEPLTEHVLAGEHLDESQLRAIAEQPLVPAFPGEREIEERPKERLVDPEETITLENGQAKIEVGARGSTSWQFDDGSGTLVETLFEEFFMLSDADGNTLLSTEMNVRNKFSTVGSYDETGQRYPGIDYVTTLEGKLGRYNNSPEICVNRRVRLDACNSLFDIVYEVTLEKDDATIDDVYLYQYCDFDLGQRDGDRGSFGNNVYNISRVEPADGGGPTVGFRGVDHENMEFHVGQAPAHKAIFERKLNGEDSYPTDGGGDSVLIQGWNLGMLSTGNINSQESSNQPDTESLTVRIAGYESPNGLTSLLAKSRARVFSESAEVISVKQPPTAVTVDQSVPISVILDTCVDDSLLGGRILIEGTKSDMANVDNEIPLEVNVIDEGLIELEGSIGLASSLVDGAEGFGYESRIELFGGYEDNVVFEYPNYGGTPGDETETWKTYYFENVDSVLCVPALPSDKVASNTGEELFKYLRKKAEFLNEYFASGLGSMGGFGFDFHFLTSTDHPEVSGGWLLLDKEEIIYEDGRSSMPGNSNKFVEDVAEKVATEFNVQFGAENSDYDTLFVVSRYRSLDGRYSRPFYRGEIFPDGVSIKMPLKIGTEVGILEIPSELMTTHLPVSPVKTPTGYTDAVYEMIGGTKWRHELGHSMGPNNQVGLPDLYGTPPNHLGNVHEWGLMGLGGDTITSLSRFWGGDLISPREWLTPQGSVYDLETERISLVPLTEKNLGDSTTQVTSVYVDFSVKIGSNITVISDNYHVDQYYVEARKNFNQSFGDPDSTTLQSTPSGNRHSGVTVYKQHLYSTESESKLKQVLAGDLSGLVEESVPTIDFLANADGGTNQPTLTNEGEPTLETHYDSDTATTIELTDGFDAGPQIEFRRSVGELFSYEVPFVVRVTAKAVDIVADLVDDALSSSFYIPPLEVVAETTDGRKTGIDPASGNVINEIDGATVEQSGGQPTVSVPGHNDVEFTVSAVRIRKRLQDANIDPPAEIPYERTVLIDNDLSIEEIEDDGGIYSIPYISGRIRQESTGTVGGDRPDQALLTVDVDVNPRQINTRSNGEWVTAWIGFPTEVDISTIRLGSVLLGTVQAENDEKYGFVDNPPTRRRGDMNYITTKFKKDEIITQFGPGGHEPVVSGLIDETPFQGPVSFEIFDPENGGSPGNGGVP